MKFLRKVLVTGIGILTTVIFLTQNAKADDWGYNTRYFPEHQQCGWVFNGYDEYNRQTFVWVCPISSGPSVYQQSIIDNSYYGNNWYYDRGYNRSGFSIQFGTGGGFPFPFFNRRHH
jgi:hypothetical protein